jgi:hypothetical protein
MLPWISCTYPDRNWLFQQNGTLVHTTISLAESIDVHWYFAVLLKYLLSLNSLNYGTWGTLQAKGNTEIRDL